MLGLRQFGFVTLTGINAGTYAGGVRASFAGDASYLPSLGPATSSSSSERVHSSTWPPPSPIRVRNAAWRGAIERHGERAWGARVHAASGTILPVGDHQTLSVVFTPVDLVNYTVVNAKRHDRRVRRL